MWDIAFIILAVVINVYILVYLFHLEKVGCQCAMNWRRNYIMFFVGLSLVLAILSLVKVDLLTSSLLMTLFSALSIANVVFILQYVHMLKKEQCQCSESLAREIMQVIAVLYAFFYIMLFIVLLYSGFKISSIVALSKQLSTNDPRQMATVMNKTLSTAKKAMK